MDENLERQLRDMLDREAITRLLIRYSNANDSDDWDALADCFAEDGGWAFDPGAGRKKLREGFETIRERGAAMMSLDKIVRGFHSMNNIEIDLDGDRATSFCLCNVAILGVRDGKDVVLLRGITYRDRLVRTHEGWKIKERAHELAWMAEVDPKELVQAHERT